MKNKLLKIPLKFLKYTGIGLGIILLLMFLLPYIFPGFVTDKIKSWANKSIESELNFSKVRLSFFNHFPSLTLTLYDVNLKGSEPYKKDTLIAAKEIALGVDVTSIFSDALRINEVYITNGKINILVNEKGLPNYNIYKNSSKETTNHDKGNHEDASLKLDRIQIENCALNYHDKSIPILIKSNNVNYVGKGDLSKAIFDLSSTIKMEGLDIVYDNEPYLINKDVKAKLITRINTHSLELDFQKNNLRINHLPIELKGKFNFLKNGYSIDLDAKTKTTDFKNLFTALPPAFVQWVDKTNVKGKVNLTASVKGDFIKSLNISPSVLLSMNVTDGSFTTSTIKEPIKNILFSLHFSLPQLNTEKLSVKVDTLHAVMGKDFINAALELTNLNTPTIKGFINANANLEQWNNILELDSIAGVHLKGQCNVQAKFNGKYNMKKQEFPVVNATILWNNGYLKTSQYPNPITNIVVDAAINNTKGNTKDIKINIKPIALNFEGQPFTIAANLNNFDNLVYQISSKGNLNIGKLYKLFAIKGYDINGFIKTNFSLAGSQEDALAGRYNKLNNQGNIELKSINISTPYLPEKFIIDNGTFHFNNDKLIAENVSLNYLKNNAVLKGQFSNIINYVLKDNEPLKGELTLKSNHLSVQDFMSFTADSIVNISSQKNTNKNTTQEQQGVVIIPSNLNLQFNANINTVDYNGLKMNNCIAKAAMQQGKLIIGNAGFTIIGSPVNMQADYLPISTRRAKFNYHISAKELDIQKAYKEIKLFRDMLTTANKFKGLVSLDYTLSGLLNDSLYPVFPTLQGEGVLSIKDAKAYGFKMFNAISKKTNKESINNPDLSKHTINLKTKIAKNIITIERIKLRVAGFRPRFEGQISFDGRLNLKARLGLPPFGIFGIPLSITGTQEKPIVKLKRGKKADDLEETDADEEDKKEAAEAEAKEKEMQQKSIHIEQKN
ncbi:MAG: hypothetical protein AMXMBFR79_00570 [Chitinophagaceae bacterium]